MRRRPTLVAGGARSRNPRAYYPAAFLWSACAFACGFGGRPIAGECRVRETSFERPSEHQLCFEHLLLEPLRDRMAVGRVGHGFPKGRARAVQPIMKLPSHPAFDILTFAA